MGTAQLEILFGSRAHELKDCYRLIHNMTETRAFLKQNLDELSAELAQLDESQKRDTDTVSTLSTELSKEVDKLERKHSSLLKSHRDIHDIVDAPIRRVSHDILSFFTSSKASYELREEGMEISRKMRAIEKKLDKKKEELKKTKSRLKGLLRPIGSLRFAIEKLEENIAEIDEQLRDQEHQIIHSILGCARQTSLALMMRKNRQLAAAGSPDLMNHILELKQAQIRLCHLKALPNVEVLPAPFHERDLEIAIEGALCLRNCSYRGKIEFSGNGHAHKKVRSGKNTRWKEVDVAFSGYLPANGKVDHKAWKAEETVKVLAEKADAAFQRGLKASRDKDKEDVLKKLTALVHRLVSEVRVELEAV